MLNDNFGFSNVDDSDDDAISLGWETMSAGAENYYFY